MKCTIAGFLLGLILWIVGMLLVSFVQMDLAMFKFWEWEKESRAILCVFLLLFTIIGMSEDLQ